MFDPDTMNSTVASTLCNKVATWVKPSGANNIYVAFNNQPIYESEDTLMIAGESITAECRSITIYGMQRKETLVIDGIDYVVLNIQQDGNGWAVINLDKL